MSLKFRLAAMGVVVVSCVLLEVPLQSRAADATEASITLADLPPYYTQRVWRRDEIDPFVIHHSMFAKTFEALSEPGPVLILCDIITSADNSVPPPATLAQLVIGIAIQLEGDEESSGFDGPPVGNQTKWYQGRDTFGWDVLIATFQSGNGHARIETRWMGLSPDSIETAAAVAGSVAERLDAASPGVQGPGATPTSRDLGPQSLSPTAAPTRLPTATRLPSIRG